MEQSTLYTVNAIASIFTAIGTVGAVIVSLYFSMRPLRERAKITTDIVYQVFDRNGYPLPYVVSAQSANIEDLKKAFSNFEKILRLSIHNTGETAIQINGFYFLNTKNKKETLFIDNSKCENGQALGNPIEKNCHFSMLMPIKFLASDNLRIAYKNTKKPKKHFCIGVETTKGKEYTTRLPAIVHKHITDTFPDFAAEDVVPTLIGVCSRLVSLLKKWGGVRFSWTPNWG